MNIYTDTQRIHHCIVVSCESRLPRTISTPTNYANTLAQFANIHQEFRYRASERARVVFQLRPAPNARPLFPSQLFEIAIPSLIMPPQTRVRPRKRWCAYMKTSYMYGGQANANTRAHACERGHVCWFCIVFGVYAYVCVSVLSHTHTIPHHLPHIPHHI